MFPKNVCLQPYFEPNSILCLYHLYLFQVSAWWQRDMLVVDLASGHFMTLWIVLTIPLVMGDKMFCEISEILLV